MRGDRKVIIANDSSQKNGDDIFLVLCIHFCKKTSTYLSEFKTYVYLELKNKLYCNITNGRSS